MSCRTLILSTLILLLSAPSLIQAEESTGSQSGKDLFYKWCVQCHANTPMAAGTGALMRKKGPVMGVLEKAGLPEAYTKAIVRSGLGSMPPYRRTELSDAQVDAIAQYLASPSIEQ